jgi:hypothetical protein
MVSEGNDTDQVRKSRPRHSSLKVPAKNVTAVPLAINCARIIVSESGKPELRNAGGTDLSLALPGLAAFASPLLFCGHRKWQILLTSLALGILFSVH